MRRSDFQEKVKAFTITLSRLEDMKYSLEESSEYRTENPRATFLEIAKIFCRKVKQTGAVV